MNPRGEKNHLLKIDSVWLAISVDDDGNEGVCAILVNSQWFPLIAADPARLDFVRREAESIARHDQRLVHVVHMASRTLVESFDGRH